MSLKLLYAFLILALAPKHYLASPTMSQDHFAGKTEESTPATPPRTPFQSLQIQGPDYVHLVMRSDEAIRDMWPPMLTIAMFYNPTTQQYHKPVVGGYRLENGVTHRVSPPLSEQMALGADEEQQSNKYTLQLLGWQREVETLNEFMPNHYLLLRAI
jgi:hypothetical protein